MRRGVTYIVALALGVTAAAGGARATTPIPECAYDAGTGALRIWDDTTLDLPAVWITYAGEKFLRWDVDWRAAPGNTARLVLENCSSGRTLTVLVPHNRLDPIYDRFDRMVGGTESYTMRAVGHAMTAMGATVRTDRRPYGTCACDSAVRNGWW